MVSIFFKYLKFCEINELTKIFGIVICMLLTGLDDLIMSHITLFCALIVAHK